MRKLLPNLSSVVLTVGAVFFVLGGAAVAGTHYLITSKKQIAPSVMKQLTKPGPRGLAGPRGSTGAAGAAGAAGTFNAANVTVVNGPTVAYGDGTRTGSSTAICPSGDTVISGGFHSVFGEAPAVLNNGPSGTTAWSVTMAAIVTTGGNSAGAVSGYGGDGQFYAQAVCASPTS